MSDFVNGDRVEVRSIGEWIPALVVGPDVSAPEYTVCQRADDMCFYHGGSYAWFADDDIRRPRLSLEERLAELAEGYGGQEGGVAIFCRPDHCPSHGKCAVCRASLIHALMLAAVEEARDGDR